MKEKDAKKLLSELSERVKSLELLLASENIPIEVAEADSEEIFFVNGEPAFIRSRGMLFPTLASNRFLSIMSKAIVNMGAVPYVCNGADVMAPGVVRYEGAFEVNDLVVVVDERHNKPISIALALCSSEEAAKLTRGKVLRNIHYVGDGVWNTMKQLGQTK